MVIKAIPQAMVNMVKSMFPYDVLVPQMPSLYLDKLDFKDKKFTNKTVRSALTSVPLKRKNLFNDYPKETIIRISH